MIPNFDIKKIDKDIVKTNKTLSKSIKTKNKKEFLYIEKQKTFKDLIKKLPLKNESLHIVNNSKFDFYTIIPFMCGFEKIEELYISTWVMSRENIIDLFKLFDTNKINNVKILTGIYFKTRESGIYGSLIEGASKRNISVCSFRNHTKILLLKTKDNYYTSEGSANLNANPRLEQYIISNSKELYGFHKNWMENKINE